MKAHIVDVARVRVRVPSMAAEGHMTVESSDVLTVVRSFFCHCDFPDGA